MATIAQMYDEIARILRETCNNVEYEGDRYKSQLLCDVALTIDNLATLVQNISTEVKTENEKRSDAFVIACAYIINNGLADDFKTFLKEKVATSRERYNHERYNNAYNLYMNRFATQL